MSFLNPIQIGGGAINAVNQSLPQLPFSPNSLNNLLPSLVGGVANKTATNLLSLVIGPNPPLVKQLETQPSVKVMTFLLRDSNGQLAPTNTNYFPTGYQFNMYVNPQTLTINYPQKMVNKVRTMGGWVLQYWFPELGTLNGEGMTGNLLEEFNNDTKDSSAWTNFKNLIQVYQNNGVAYQPNSTNRNLQSFLPTAECHYDGFIYKGYFESFSYTEEESSPWSRKYNFAFNFTDIIDTGNITALTQYQLSTVDNLYGPRSVVSALTSPSLNAVKTQYNVQVKPVVGAVSSIPGNVSNLSL